MIVGLINPSSILGLQGFCNSKSEKRCTPSDEIGLQSLGTTPFVLDTRDGLFLHVLAPQISKYFPCTFILGWFPNIMMQFY